MFFRSIFSLLLHAFTDLESRLMLTQNALRVTMRIQAQSEYDRASACKLFALVRVNMDHPRPVNHFLLRRSHICKGRSGSLNKNNKHLFGKKIYTYYFDEKMPPG